MQFAFRATRRTPHGASRLVQAMSAWLVKTRRAPSRHSRDARVYVHSTTAVHKLSTPSPAPFFPRHTRKNRFRRYATQARPPWAAPPRAPRARAARTPPCKAPRAAPTVRPAAHASTSPRSPFRARTARTVSWGALSVRTVSPGRTASERPLRAWRVLSGTRVRTRRRHRFCAMKVTIPAEDK